MSFIVFKIPFSNNYNGLEDSSLNLYDKFYQEKKSNNPEIYNFQDYNGFCYGYAPLKEGKIDLSKTNFKNDSSVLFENALVLWVCEKDGKNFLVGFYKDATIYNFLQRIISYPSVGRDLYFNVKAKSENCFLLPVQNRSFKIDIDFSKNNFYISDKNDILYEKFLDFINSYNGEFSNIVLKNFLNETILDAPNNPKLLYKRGTIFLYNETNPLEALKYFNTCLKFKNMLNEKEIIDVYYVKALALLFLNCFDEALYYFEKVVNNIYDTTIIKNIIYLSMYTNKYLNAILYCDKILKKEEITQESKLFLNEITCLKIDCYINLNKFSKAKKLLEDLINSDTDENLKSHCKSLLKAIS